MKVIYHNKKIEDLCENFTKATKKLGKEVAEKLHKLMNLLESFTNLYDIKVLPTYRLHLLKGDRQNQYSITLSKGSKWRLILYPLDEDENVITDLRDEKAALIKSIKIEILEVSEHYE